MTANNEQRTANSLKRLFVIAKLVLIATLMPAFSHGDLVEYSFTTPSGEQRTLPHSERYANPAGTIEFTLRAGIDRKIRLSLLRPDGSPDFSQQWQLYELPFSHELRKHS